MVFCAIAFIQVSQTPAGKARTVGAETSAPLRAGLDFAGHARLGLAAIIASAAGAPVPVAQKSVAEAAVHAARSDEGGRIQTLRWGSYRHRSPFRIPLLVRLT